MIVVKVKGKRVGDCCDENKPICQRPFIAAGELKVYGNKLCYDKQKVNCLLAVQAYPCHTYLNVRKNSVHILKIPNLKQAL